MMLLNPRCQDKILIRKKQDLRGVDFSERQIFAVLLIFTAHLAIRKMAGILFVF